MEPIYSRAYVTRTLVWGPFLGINHSPSPQDQNHP